MAFRKAERRKAKLRMGLVGPAGSGKTYSSLIIAAGLGDKIALIDTENGSGDLYAGMKGIPDYDICQIEPPYTVQKYLAALKAAEEAGYDVAIIDSLTHAWAGEGGLLDQQGKLADSGRGNSYTAWRQITPLHNKLVEAMLTSRCHIIATMRAKTEYVLKEETKNGRTIQVPQKVGMAPVQRDGMDYEFTLVIDLDVNHNAQASKDRTSLFDGQIFTPSKDTGQLLKKWLESGSDFQPAPLLKAKTEKAETSQKSVDQSDRRSEIWRGYLMVCGNANHAKNAILKIVPGKPSKVWNEDDMKKLEKDLQRRIDETMEKEASGEIFQEAAELSSEPVPASDVNGAV
ncbi:MAG: AAA family ATPase [Aminobacterium sp.]|uniref:AAA family ATPase n=1 Tax=Aminobacterium sp. TaxID=1872491 RepID=UPI002B215052|nr:AAA family ATPase [Aminobacterium sp.]MEA4876810.1 AAA family ATPase [Aminobacterium sp.]